jgi:hypothetical protein
MYGDKSSIIQISSTVPAEFLIRLIENANVLFGSSIWCQLSSQTQIPTQRPDAPFNQHDPVTIFLSSRFRWKDSPTEALSHQRELDSCHRSYDKNGKRSSRSAAVVPDYPGTNATEPRSQANRIYIALATAFALRAIPRKQCPRKLTNKEHHKCCWFTSTHLFTRR